MMTRKLLLLFVILTCIHVSTAVTTATRSQENDKETGSAAADSEEEYHDDDREYVRQVLQDEDPQQHNPYDNAYSTDEEYQQYQDALAQQQAQEAQEAANRRAAERERAFEQQLAHLSKEEQTRAQRKKRRDARIVQRVLKAFAQKNYYTVLGLQHRVSFSRRVPRWIPSRLLPKLCRSITQSDIKQAYRTMGKRVHPDKNADGKADQAFVALEEAFGILHNEESRQAYDAEFMNKKNPALLWWQQHRHAGKVYQVWRQTHRVVTTTMSTVRKIVGPFSVPLGILAVVFV